MNRSDLLARFVRETDADVVMLAARYTLLEQPALDDLLSAALERGVCAVVGLRTRGQVQDCVARHRRPVPEALWAELRDCGLLREEVPAGRRNP
jgi:hypothetical protein